VETGFHGALAIPRSRGDLGGREVLDVSEHHDDAMVRVKGRQGAMQHIALVYACEVVTAGKLRRIGNDNRADRAPAHSGPAPVHQDPVEPGIDALRVAQLPPVKPGLDRRVVDGVLGLGRVAEDEAG